MACRTVDAPFDSVLVVAFGGPTKFDEVRPFLDNVLRGRPVPPSRYEEVVEHYRAIGGASPINALTIRQAEMIAKDLGQEGPRLKVYVGMRNWAPYIADVMAQMADEGKKRAVGVILSAHRCEASWERYLGVVKEAQAKLGDRAPRVEPIEPFHEDPLFVTAAADRVREALEKLPPERRDAARLVFTAHSIPVAMAKASRYAEEIRASAEAACRRLHRRDFAIAWQSRSGSPRDPWLEPDIGDWIRAAAKEGAKDVVAMPIGFVVDHVEVLYDLDVEAKRIAAESGVGFVRAGTVSDHPFFIRALAERIRGAAVA